MCISLLGHYCPDVTIIIIIIMPFLTLQSGLLIGILDYIVPLDFDHIKLVSKPGPKEWPYPPAFPLNALRELSTYSRQQSGNQHRRTAQGFI